MDILDELESHILPGDGDARTMLLDAGVPSESCMEGLCLSQPDLVISIHQQYIAAGARIIATNSLGSNAVRLEKQGLGNRVNELNWTAARLARDAARGKQVYVAGCVGQLGITAAEAAGSGIDRRAVYQEQIGALLDGGADLIFFKAFLDVEELALAMEIKESLHHCPVIGSLACSSEGRLASGLFVGEAFSRLWNLGAAVVGVSCPPAGPCGLVQLLRQVPRDGLLCAYPNARDSVPSAGFAETARNLAAEGARLIGGGCGTRSEHIAALTEAIRELKPIPNKPV